MLNHVQHSNSAQLIFHQFQKFLTSKIPSIEILEYWGGSRVALSCWIILSIKYVRYHHQIQLKIIKRTLLLLFKFFVFWVFVFLQLFWSILYYIRITIIIQQWHVLRASKLYSNHSLFFYYRLFSLFQTFSSLFLLIFPWFQW